jgi:uncharacterized heparinase superfamily protein
VTFNDTSSCDFLERSSWRRVYGTPITGGPREVAVAREELEDGGVLVRTSHDGYARRFGIVHHRSLRLSGDGNTLDGEELFIPSNHEVLPPDALDHFAVRFHLHPAVRANRLTDGRTAVLILPNKEVWNFDAHEDRVEIEESVYLAGLDGPRRTVQIVILGRARSVSRVHWTLSHAPVAPLSRRTRGEEPELPL